ncbi:hypothetical protein A3F66_01080 [candidate division TM6 bacterium RIFCSPHIGHO2_12_FULL_32_22]|nr:MAG: hypothetical protein A3F66_01080 [candidate division TM6 bacterium RIFCSPHIGHO2_12_FULL_32_22]
MQKNRYFGEIIDSSLVRWMAQSWKWDKFPNFGSLIAVEQGDLILYGIVSEIKTGSQDSSRFPYAYQKTEEELLRDQPQIFEFLNTIFTCVPVAYKSVDIIYNLPPRPAKIHSFVREMDLEEKQLLDISSCLPVIFGNSEFQSIDELLLALIKNAQLDKALVHSFIDNFSLLCGNDYRRIKIFIKRLESFLQ